MGPPFSCSTSYVHYSVLSTKCGTSTPSLQGTIMVVKLTDDEAVDLDYMSKNTIYLCLNFLCQMVQKNNFHARNKIHGSETGPFTLSLLCDIISDDEPVVPISWYLNYHTQHLKVNFKLPWKYETKENHSVYRNKELNN